MNNRAIILAFLFLTASLACGGGKDTPPEVLESYRQVKSELDEEALGASIGRLEELLEKYSEYTISSVIRQDIEAMRDKVDGRFDMARQLAREGELERAERILRDLVTYFPETKDGERAGEYMRFEFPVFKAQRLMMDGRVGEAESVLEEVKTKELEPQQARIVEQILDGLSNARYGVEKARVQSMKAACKQLHTLLEMYRAEHGEYPGSLSLSALELGGSSSEKVIKENLSSIENYRGSQDRFSLTAVGRDGETRINITQDGIEESAEK